MEKSKDIFDVSLDSMLSSPIEVNAVGDSGYNDSFFETPKPADKEKEAAAKKAVEDEQKDLIDLEDTNEEEEEESVEEISEDPSSNIKDTPQKGNKAKSSSPLTPYAKLLIDEGVLPNLNLEKFDGTADSLKEAMINEIVGAVDSYKDSLPDRIKSLINNYEEGVPLERLLEIDRIESDITKVTEEKLEEDTRLQRQVVSDYLKRTTKFSEAKITKLLDGYEDSGELEDEAKSSLSELKNIVSVEKKRELENAEASRKQAEEQRKKELSSLQEKVKTTDEIIPGLKLNDKVRNNVFSSMTTPVGYDQAGRPVNKIVAARMENPVEFEIKLHYLFEITKGFTDFTKLADKGRKDASKSFEEAIENLDKSSFEDAGANEVKRKSNDFVKTLQKTYKF